MSAASPMDPLGRLDAYLGAFGSPAIRKALTPAQRRRVAHKANRAHRVERQGEAGRELTPRQARWAGIRAVRAARKAGASL